MSSRRARPPLASDTRGAIALLGLFMAVFLTAAFYYVVGIGETVLYRERMQDAADAAAFSAAALHARGMNLIALVNMTMAALLAVLVALKLLETVIAIALVIIAVSSFFAPGLASAIPILAQLRNQVTTAHDELRDPIHGMLETLHAAGQAVREVVPAASAARGAQIAALQPDSPLEFALVVPSLLTLPTEDGTFAELCGQAGNYVGETAKLGLGVMPGAIAGEVGAAIEDLARARADWFCGADGAAPPSTRRTHTLRHPSMPSRLACQRQRPDDGDYDPQRHATDCEQAERDEQASKPDPTSGKCGHGCERAMYDQRAELARRACAPREGGDELQGFLWQERRFSRSYRFSRGTWRVTSDREAEDASARRRLRTTKARPCGHSRAQIGTDWNMELQDPEGDPLPLCSNARPPSSVSAREGQSGTLVHTEVAQIFGCSEKVQRDYGLGDDDLTDRVTGGDDGDKTPQVLAADVELGEEPFQIRAVALGATPPGTAGRVIEVAAWGRELQPTEDWRAQGAAQLGRVAVAQAEYFYAVDDPESPERASFLWNMRWQARLRRFRWPNQDGKESDGGSVVAELSDACEHALESAESDASSACAMLETDVDRIAH